jgi:hypothetical protein
MHPMRHGRTILAAVAVVAAMAIPSTVTAQAPYRGACDLLTDEAASGILGVEVAAQREGPRTQCFYTGAEASPVTIWLNPDATLSMFASQDGVESLSVGDLEAIWWPSQSRLIATLPFGGVLDLSTSGQGGSQPKDGAVALAEAILASGPVSAIPPDKGPAESLYLEGSMCDILSPDEVNAITGGTFGPLEDLSEGGDDPNCTLQDPSGFVIFVLSDDLGHTVDAGTYTSEDLAVAGRPAIWEPDREFLTLDAGDGITLAVGFSSNEPDPETRKPQAVAIAEAIVPRLSTDAPAVPESAECTVSLDDLSRITGLEIVNGVPFGPVCYYASADPSMQRGALIGVLPGDDPAAALEAAEFSSEVAPTPSDFEGRAALVVDTPEGASIAVDLDGLPAGDGQVLLVAVGGLDGDQMAVASEIVRYVISTM